MFSKGQIEASVAMKLLADGFSLPPAVEPSTETSAAEPHQANKRSPDSDAEDGLPSKVARPEPLSKWMFASTFWLWFLYCWKARLRRLCEEKAGGKLQVPEWLHQQWKTRDHMEMALEYEKCGFDKDHFFKATGPQGSNMAL